MSQFSDVCLYALEIISASDVAFEMVMLGKWLQNTEQHFPKYLFREVRLKNCAISANFSLHTFYALSFLSCK